ncbi:MAG: hypothetical protein QF819_04905 [Gemmatimonadota bacterium]|jgi:hypothetical protein|nr:hypothetical protein [Gemmatimonadota bacterium]MDP6529712.1 hypothetical protein [Gemmatimonadota bacterium]MDP6802499.1 hypothetical protein [Gemmatimonadota bacterium]MDP7030944.1 hypothetical protein [Gemmatimonadota bacterium]
MMKGVLIGALAGVAVAACLAPAFAGESAVQTGATFYFDYFASLSDADSSEAERGFRVRRSYLTVKKSWDDLMFRFTTDVDTKYGTDNLNVFVKYAYLQWKGLIPGATVLIGQHSPGTNAWTEKRWGLRSVSMAMSDERKWTHSAVLGVGAKGECGESGLSYAVSINNGNGYKSPLARDGQGFAGRIAWAGNSGLIVSGMASSNNPGDADDANLYFEGSGGFTQGTASCLVQYGRFEDGPSGVVATGISAFARVGAGDLGQLFARIDIVDEDTDTASDGETVLTGGFDIELSPGFHLQPNVRVVNHEDGNEDSETEARLTFFAGI